MTRLRSVLLAVTVGLLAPLTVDGQMRTDLSLGLGARYVRAFDADGLGGEMDVRLSFPSEGLGAKPALGLEAWVLSVATRMPVTLYGIGIRPRVEWSMLAGRVRPHLSVVLDVLRADRHALLVCFVPEDGGGCLPHGDTGLAAGVEYGIAVRVTEGLAWTVRGGARENTLDWVNSGTLWAVGVGLAYRWHVRGHGS